MTFTFTQKIALGLVLILALLILVLVSKNTENQRTEETKQSQSTVLKRTLEIVTYTLFLTVTFCLIGFGLTREYAFLFALIGAGIPWGIIKFTTILLIWPCCPAADYVVSSESLDQEYTNAITLDPDFLCSLSKLYFYNPSEN